jgi:drug/metabolite transporter (DMT)-like permease
MMGVIGFSLTLPMTLLANADLDPTFVGLGRAIIAAVLAAIALWLARAPIPVGYQWLRLGGVALGVVVGFPLLSSWALMTLPAAHSAVIGGLLPLMTAIFAVVLNKERPSLLFWGSTVVGSATLVAFSLYSHGGGIWLR